MLDFFTDPYPNELLYSAVARYHYYIGNSYYVDTNLEVYGVRKPISNFYFGVYLDFLLKSLEGSYSLKEIIFNHTIFPFYQPFITEDLNNKIINEMKFGNPNFSGLCLFRTRICKKNYLYYCPKCANEDINKYGEAYFHVEHQLDGISICSKHKLSLKPYTSFELWKNNYDYIKFDKTKAELESDFPIVDEIHKKIIDITKLSHELFTLDTSNINKQKLCKYYKNVLKEKGFASLTGKIRRKKLKEAMVNYYGVDLLNKLESTIEINNIYNWVDTMFLENKELIHPIKHLLLISFLGQTISDIIVNIDKHYEYFGNGPWPCLNHICGHYNEDIINTIEIKYVQKNIVGVFKCNVCGFIYSRLYSKENDNKYVVRQVLDKGHLWFNTLKELGECGDYSIKEIAKIMKTSSTSISSALKKLKVGRYKNYNISVYNEGRLKIKKDILLNAKKKYSLVMIKKKFKKEFRYVEKYDEKWLYSNLSYKKRTRNSEKEKLETYKQKFIELKKINPNISLRELNSSLSNAVCNFIKKNDSKWWEENAPESKVGTNRKSGLLGNRVDWPNRDEELLILLKDKYKEICNREDVTYITRNLFKKEIFNIPITLCSLEKMPKSKTFIESIVDSTQSYKIKCYKKYLYDKYENDNDNVTINDIPRKFHNFYKQDESVIKELEEYIDILKKQAEII